jgi:outer membrane protein assembly factor BamA
MRARSSISSVILLLLAWGCSNTRFLAEDELLYTGREKAEIIFQEPDSKSAEVKNYVNSVTSHKVNNALFGRRILPPIGLWTQNYWKVNEKRRFRAWLHKTFASDQILVSDVNPELRARNIESELFDLGYFNTKAWSVIDTSSRNPKKAMLKYFVEVAPPFHYNQIAFDTLLLAVDTLLNSVDYEKYIKPGDQFNLGLLKTARTNLSRTVQNEGYFYFTPEFIDLKADTSRNTGKVDLLIGRKKGLEASLLLKYGIDEIIVNISRGSDTAFQKTDTLRYNGLNIVSSGDYLKPDVLRRAVYFETGDIYSYSDYQQTISRLNNLGIFSYVRISYTQSQADSLHRLLDVRIDLVLSDNISLDLEADLVTKSTGYAGPQLSAGVTHGNTFKGAEKTHLALNGGLEWQWGNKSQSELGTLSYEFGIGAGITFPKLILPGSQDKSRLFRIQETSVNLDYDFINRTAYYRMASQKAEYKYRWGKTQRIYHSLSPIYVNSVNLLETTPEFDSVVDANIYIRKSYEEQFIFGVNYSFTYDNTLRTRPHNFYYQAGFHGSGNTIDLFAGIGKDASDRPHYFLGNIYSQHLKFTSDFRYYLHGLKNTLAFRFYAGLGIPYGNSEVLPYVEQFFSGGAYSIRGFTARYVGPGSYHEDSDGFIDQSGDIKLESNLEYRFGMSKVVKGAIFLDAGNIWLANEDENRPGSQFEFRTFYNQLAVGAGFGLRFDFTFFVLRTDLGFPIRNPYQTDGENWLFGTGQGLKGALIYLAIGYPF